MVYIACDIGTSGVGNYDTTKELIDIIAEAGANCAKFQIIRPERLPELMLGNHTYQTADGPKEEDTKTMLLTAFIGFVIGFSIGVILMGYCIALS